jgi:hypothetical protein
MYGICLYVICGLEMLMCYMLTGDYMLGLLT